MHGGDGFDHFALRSIFQQISLRAGLNSSIDVFVGLKASQHDDLRMVRSLRKRAQNFNAVHPGHAKIKKNHIRRFALQQFESFLTARRGTDYFQSGLSSQHAGEARTHHWMIIDDKNTDVLVPMLWHSIDAPESIAIYIRARLQCRNGVAMVRSLSPAFHSEASC